MGLIGHVTELLPGYALGCLDADELQMVEGHLAGCLDCQREWRAYQETAGLLALSVEQVMPPREVKEKLMARIRRASPEAPRPVAITKRRAALDRLFVNFTPAWVLASLLLVLVLGASNLVLWQQVRQMRADLAMPLRVVALTGTSDSPTARGVIVISGDGMHGTVVVDNLTVLREDQQYQLWLIEDGKRVSGAVFSVGQDGYASAYIKSPQPLINYDGFGVTIEPAGGSPAPTGTKVLGGDL